MKWLCSCQPTKNDGWRQCTRQCNALTPKSSSCIFHSPLAPSHSIRLDATNYRRWRDMDPLGKKLLLLSLLESSRVCAFVRVLSNWIDSAVHCVRVFAWFAGVSFFFFFFPFLHIPCRISQSNNKNNNSGSGGGGGDILIFLLLPTFHFPLFFTSYYTKMCCCLVASWRRRLNLSLP